MMLRNGCAIWFWSLQEMRRDQRVWDIAAGARLEAECLMCRQVGNPLRDLVVRN